MEMYIGIASKLITGAIGIFIKGATKENSVLQCQDEFRIARDS